MKGSKLVTLDVEVIEALKHESNASSLINGLLIEHFQKENYRFMTKEQLKIEHEILDIEEDSEKRVKELRRKQNECRRT